MTHAGFERGERYQQFGLASGLEAVPVGRAEAGDLLDHLALLVHFDREHAAEGAAVVQSSDRAGEALVENRDLCVKKVFDAKEHRHLPAALAHSFDDFRDTDADAAIGELHVHRYRAIV